MDIEIKTSDGVASFDLELPKEASDAIHRVWATRGGRGKFMICQPQCRGADNAWRLRGRILNGEFFDVISEAIEGQTERQKFNHRNSQQADDDVAED